jgi:hypothetical protein
MFAAAHAVATHAVPLHVSSVPMPVLVRKTTSPSALALQVPKVATVGIESASRLVPTAPPDFHPPDPMLQLDAMAASPPQATRLK